MRALMMIPCNMSSIPRTQPEGCGYSQGRRLRHSTRAGLFGTGEKDESRPGKEDDEEKDDLPNQSGVHTFSSERGDLRLGIFFIKIGYLSLWKISCGNSSKEDIGSFSGPN